MNSPDLSQRRGPRKPPPAPDSAEVVTSSPAPAPEPEPTEAVAPEPAPSTPTPQVTTSIDGFAEWEPPAVVKLTTQITVEHRKLLHLLERQTGTSLWKLIGHAIDETYGKKD